MNFFNKPFVKLEEFLDKVQEDFDRLTEAEKVIFNEDIKTARYISSVITFCSFAGVIIKMARK